MRSVARARARGCPPRMGRTRERATRVVRAFCKGGFSSFIPSRAGRQGSTDSPVSIDNLEKKDPEGAAGIFLVDHSLHAPSLSFLYIHEGFIGDGWLVEAKGSASTWRSDKPTLIDLRARNAALAKGKEIFFRIASVTMASSKGMAFNAPLKSAR